MAGSISHEDAALHQGRLLSGFTVNTALADGGSIGIVLKVAGSAVHANFWVNGGGKGRARIYEAPVVSSSTALTLWNMNRAASYTTGASAGHSPAFTTGSVIGDIIIPGTTGGNKVGGDVRTDVGYILNTDTTYIVAACNLSGGAAGYSIYYQGFEEQTW